MNAVIVTAGGIGVRVGLEIPKQFVVVKDKPIIIHTLEIFEQHEAIDLICVPCLHGWEDRLRAYAEEFKISKLKIITQGGASGFESIRNGLYALKGVLKDDDIVMIHDSIRPLVSHKVISDNLEMCKQKGNAITIIPSVEALLLTHGANASNACIDRETVKRTQTPHSIYFGDFLALHAQAAQMGITESVALPSLLTELGHVAYFSAGDEGNIKITTAKDIELVEALLSKQKSHFESYQEMCVEGNKKLVEYGLVILTWGNFSLRIPGTDLICIKPSGVHYASLQAEMIPIVRLDGSVVQGRLKPSVDLPTHLEIYRHNPKITNITHTHSSYASAFAQALREIPLLGTTHADFYHEAIPLSRTLSANETQEYEANTGKSINELLLQKGEQSPLPAVLVPHHAPFIFGHKTFDSCENALILESIAQMAYFSLNLNAQLQAMPEALVHKAYNRKHGANAYYGQPTQLAANAGGGAIYTHRRFHSLASFMVAGCPA